uniref:Uncharacterized protein n=1 Tax=Amblyomma triste TaxID=251400 RepID=A0A023G750_AMBTT
MNRGRVVIFAPKKRSASLSRQLSVARQKNVGGPPPQVRSKTTEDVDDMQVRQRLAKVARRLGLVFGVRSKSTAEESLVTRSSLRKSPTSTTAKAKKTVRFEESTTKTSSKKLVKRTISKACRYVSLGALCSSPVLLTSFPTEPNMATSHRSAWSSWTEPVTWSHGAQMYM